MKDPHPEKIIPNLQLLDNKKNYNHKFFGGRLECAQRGLFPAKGCRKKCGKHTFFVQMTVWGPPK
jgi:hypothetical protein